MNNDNFDEVLNQEEVVEINEKLEEIENITLPESLNFENIAEKLEGIKQFVPETEKAESKKRNKKKRILSTIATAAAFIVAVTSIMVAYRHNQTPPLKPAPNNNPIKVQDYSEIETKFVEYSTNYKNYQHTCNGRQSIGQKRNNRNRYHQHKCKRRNNSAYGTF